MEQTTRPPRRIQRAETEPRARTWCRVQINLSLVPPAPGKVISIDKGPYSLRVTVFGPKSLLGAALVAALATHPWAAVVIAHARKWLGW